MYITPDNLSVAKLIYWIFETDLTVANTDDRHYSSSQVSNERVQKRRAAFIDVNFAMKETIDVGASFIQQFCHLLLNASLRLTLEMEGTHRIYVLYLFSFFFFIESRFEEKLVHLNKFGVLRMAMCSRNHDIFKNYYT